MFKSKYTGFTIVELLVVIVVIGILATITIVSYTGITQRATASVLQSDLTNASQQLKLYYQLYSSYPTTMVSNCPTAPTADNTYCIKASTGNTLTYTSITPSTFHLTNTNNNISYSSTDNTSPALTTTTSGSSVGSACPTGFIPVPGSGTYGTNDFCVMKYEAKQSSATVPISQASGLPWVSISQTDAITYSQNIAGCTGCHLITEAEWLTIVQNVLSVPSNWSTGTVGSGYIYSGHNDGAPGGILAADSNDANGYSGETNTGGNQKRTLRLTNNEVIWDIAGNAFDLTAGQVSSGQPGIVGAGYTYREWNAIVARGNLSPNPFPSYGTPSANSWTRGNGIGSVDSSADEAALHSFARGGWWGDGGDAGVSALILTYAPSSAGPLIGFRVSR